LVVPLNDLTRRRFLALAGAAGLATRARAGLIPLGGAGTPTPVPPGSGSFPRTSVLLTGGVFAGLYSGNIAGCNLPASTIAGQSSLITIGFYYGVESYGSYPTLMSSWKSAAIANGLTLKCFIYTEGQGYTWTIPGGAGTEWLTTAFNNGSFWSYTSASGTGTTDLTEYYGSSSPQSWLNICSSNVQTVPSFTYNGKSNVLLGYNLWNTYAQYFYDSLFQGEAVSKYGESAAMASNSQLDGLFIDNLAPQPETTGTWNGIGTTPVGVNTSTCAITMQGDAKLLAAFRALKPNIKILGNSGIALSFLKGNITALDSTYVGAMDYELEEATIGSSGSIETTYNSPPGAWMQGLIKAEAVLNSTGGIILHQVGRPNAVAFTAVAQSSWVAADWQGCRMGIAAAMMRNWYYQLNCGVQQYQSVGLMDEAVQTIGGTPNYGWLSAGTQRLDPPQSGASNLSGISGSGVWVRRFPNGWVLCNFRGNGAQTVTVPSTLYHIASRGFGVSPPNSGAQVASGSGNVTLQDGDGLFLIGTG
jgi:hypothetical protein